MKNAETVTFGAWSLDRSAHLRDRAQGILGLPNSKAIVFWRGKPLINAQTFELITLETNHAILTGFVGQIYIGQSEGTHVFAYDISDWEPNVEESQDVVSFLDETHQNHPQAPKNAAFLDLRSTMALLSPKDAELAVAAKGIFGWHQSHLFCAMCGQPSEIAQAGWQRICPTCETSHFPRTDPVVIMLITKGNNVLLGRSPGWPDGMYSLLAGFMEPGETIEAAVRREVLEESGIHVGPVSYLTSQPWPFPSSLMVGCAGIALDDQIKIDENELEDAKWVSKEDLIAVLAGHNDTMKPARKGAIAQFLIENWLKDSIS